MACTNRGLFMFCNILANFDLSANLFRDERLAMSSSERVASKDKIVA
jgi:hypothetical protein